MGGGHRPFRCFLDVGLTRTTTGNRVFAVMKGAVDGGLEVPHNMKRLIGYDSDSQQHSPETLRHYLYGGHVADYMKHLMEEDEEKYKTHFARFIKEGVTADGLEQMYKDAHAKIREDPSFTKKAPREDIKKKRWNRKKLTLKQRRDRVRQKKEAYLRKLQQEAA
ncbi:60S ribosomal protein L5 [Geodia barretti]|uniref:60S ribosomal protein L5 n=1 Tax=Geodia barretti TaxID=519541 RepID=A0AA35SZR6_GEOBA|nr:60S ribosomal protein L5 [Geodia barretti]